MYPQSGNLPPRWKSKNRKTKSETAHPKPSAFRAMNSTIAERRPSFNETKFLYRCRKNKSIGGMFANAKSSVSSASHSSFHNSSSTFEEYDEAVDETASTFPPPVKITKYSSFPRQSARIEWDFSDIATGKEEKQTRPTVEPIQRQSLPAIKKLNSEDEKQPESASSAKIPPKPKPLLPWLKKWDSEDEAAPKKPKIATQLPKLEEFKYEKTIDRFSAHFNKPDLLKPIPLQKHTETMLGTVEKAVMGVALAHRNSESRPKSFPVYDFLMKRSDWLIYREDLNDEEDYEPEDPFYETEKISSDFEEYEREMELNNIPIYKTKSEDEDEEKSGKPADNLINLSDLNNLNSQEDDFFKEAYTQLSPMQSEFDKEFCNAFSDSQKSSSPPRKVAKIGKPVIQQQSSRFFLNFDDLADKKSLSKPGTSSQVFAENPKNPISGPCSSNYSPIDYSFFTQESPQSSSTSSFDPGPTSTSKYSFC